MNKIEDPPPLPHSSALQVQKVNFSTGETFKIVQLASNWQTLSTSGKHQFLQKAEPHP